MKERPILFSGPMVRAILEGRKTVTRRALNARSLKLIECGAQAGECHYLPDSGPLHPNSVQYYADFCPYGQPGDQLWVRETWGVISHSWDEHGDMTDWIPDRPATPIRELPFGRGYYSGHTIYAADGPMEWSGDEDGGGEPRSAWKPSIHMPRAASRILLEITAARVERLHDITEQQAIEEGVHRDVRKWFKSDEGGFAHNSATDAFADLWCSINGAESWGANPWVWAVEFKRVTS
ncbi:hypothetical protein I5F71_03060 [Pseudomonas aeruginosa]|nr:hypothetical protein [Pseudomonas aeruginosa]MBG4718226.1 hypothetical protein [Pseudomonas aeruginosa]